MKSEKIHWKEAIDLLKKGNTVSQDLIEFNNDKIPVKDVGFLNKHGIRVPEDNIYYDEENIDCSEIPEITENDIKTGGIQWIKTDEFPIDNEIRTWIRNQNINLNELIPQLIKNFYETIKNIQKKVAL